MLFSIAMALMAILIAGFWAYQGVFSSALMFFECMIATLAAFGFYEVLNGVWATSLGSGIGLPLAYCVIFLAVLAGLRLMTDRVFRDDIKFPVAVDRAGAGVFGLFIGLLLVGNALVGLQMLPIGSSIFGFERVTAKPDGSLSRGGFLLAPDSFTVGLANMASGGGMSGGNPLGQAKPDMLMDMYSARSAVQTEDRHEIPETSIKVNHYYETQQIDSVKQKLDGNNLVREFESHGPASGKLLVCNVSIDAGAGLKDKTDLYLRAPQFRIVGPPPESGKTPKVYLAVGMSDIYTHKGHNWGAIQSGQKTRLVRFNPDTDFFLTHNNAKEVAITTGDEKNVQVKAWRFDVAFEVPDDFEPWYVAFKTGARTEITKAMFKQTPPKGASLALGNTGPGRTAASPEAKPKIGKAPGGTAQVANATDADVTNKVPLTLPLSESMVSSAERDGKLGECHFFIEAPKQKEPKGKQVKEFEVPEGKKIVLLDADRNQALSMYGRAMNFASNALAQITLKTDDGKVYFAQGVYAAASVGGKNYFEIQYHPEAEIPERCLIKPKKVTDAALKATPPKERRYGYIFIVDPGVKIVSFSSGGPTKEQPLNINVPK